MGEFTPEILREQDPNGINGTVTVSYDGPVAIITMNCGENRLNASFVGKMIDALEEVENNEDAQVLITTGTGKFYSNGLDLKWLTYLAQKDLSYGSEFRNNYMQKLSLKVMTFPMPTIAVVNGHAFAAGAILAAQHDYIIMTSGRGWWCMNEVDIGLRLANFTITLIRMKLGRVFHQALVLGHRFTGEEAVQYGFVKAVFPSAQLLQESTKFAKSLITPRPYDRKSLKDMKADLYREAFDAAEKDREQTHAGSVFSLKSKV